MYSSTPHPQVSHLPYATHSPVPHSTHPCLQTTNDLISVMIDLFALLEFYINGNIKVCTVYPDGSIMLTMPTSQVHDHKGMMMLVDDLKKLDEFLSIICENYNK